MGRILIGEFGDIDRYFYVEIMSVDKDARENMGESRLVRLFLVFSSCRARIRNCLSVKIKYLNLSW